MESACEIVSSYGIIFSCNVHPESPASSNPEIDLDLYLSPDVRAGATMYVCNSAVQNFVCFVLPFLRKPFVLVSGNSDEEMPADVLSVPQCQRLLGSPYLLAWFCQNWTGSDPTGKVHRIPIGLDYHTLRKHMGLMHPWGPGKTPREQEYELLAVAAAAPPLFERKRLCYSNWHHAAFGINRRGDRQEALKKIPSDIVYYDDAYTDRVTSWRTQAGMQFVLSPRGGGLDCHRTWEALILGCIPIVRSSNLDPLYEDLPVLIVKDWSDLNAKCLENFLEDVSGRQYDPRKLRLDYWVQAASDVALAAHGGVAWAAEAMPTATHGGVAWAAEAMPTHR
jgi:hypothetical protein